MSFLAGNVSVDAAAGNIQRSLVETKLAIFLQMACV